MAYIDKENIDKKIEDIISRQPTDFSSYQNGFYTAIKYLWGEISDLPTADVAEVVRCKDCVYHEKGCSLDTHPYMTPDDGYCYKGERRTNNE